MKIEYWLTKEAIKRAFVEDGKEVQAIQSITVNAAELTKDARAWLVDHSRIVLPAFKPNVYPYNPTSELFMFNLLVETPEDVELLVAAHRSAYETAQAAVNAQIDAAIAEKIDQLEAMLTRQIDFNDYAPRLPDWFKDRPLSERAKELAQQVTHRLQAERLANISARYTEYIANPSGSLFPIDNEYKTHPDYPAALALYTQAAAVGKALTAEKERAASAAKTQAEADKATWIAEFGSAHLKAAFSAGYNSQRQYVTERAAKEYPSYSVDFDDNAGWKTRSFPSEPALADALKVGGEVVWLTSGPTHGEDWEEDEEREAVVVSGFLGKYDLIK